MNKEEFIALSEGKEVEILEDRDLTEGTGYHRVKLTDSEGSETYNVDTATVLALTARKN